MSKELLQQAVNGATGETYLCRAWGETDLTLAAIVVGLDRVQAFLVEYWLGSDDHTDDDGTETLPSVMADIQKCLAGSDDRWSLEFEIGGISVETVDAVAVSRLAQPASVSDTEILALNHGEKFFSESQTRYPEAGHGTQYHAGAPGVIGFARAVITKIAQPAQEPVTDQSAKESAQRAAQAVRFAGRNGPATADFDLPATNDTFTQPAPVAQADPVQGFMCLIDWQHHMEDDGTGTKVYPSEEDLREQRTCIDQCGIAEVETRLVRVVQESDYRRTNPLPVGQIAAPVAQAEPLQVPQGWKLVPIEPTKEMWAAVNKLDDQMSAGGFDGKGCSIEQAWDCLVESAPTSPACESIAQPVPQKSGEKALDLACHFQNLACEQEEIIELFCSLS